MKKYIDRFARKVFEVSGIRLDAGEVVADEKFHLVDGQHFYVLSAVKPPVGFFGQIGCAEPEKWALKRATVKDEKVFEKKCKTLLEAVKHGLGDLCAKPQDSFPPIVENSGDGVVIRRLACLTSCEYDRVRKHEAAKLGVRVSTLDKDVEKARRSSGAQWQSKGSAQLELDL